MTPAAFRKLALSLPEAVEKAHMGHPDFRVGGRIFATLGARGDDWGMVRVTPLQQRRLIKAEPGVFEPVAGAWGRQGCTWVDLRAANTATVRAALQQAWENAAPKQAVEIYGLPIPSREVSTRGGRVAPATRRTAKRTRAGARRKRS